MNIKKFLIIVIIILIVTILAIIFNNYKSNKRVEVKIPILLYHDFVTTVPDKDPDNFNYINTPQSFEENMKILLYKLIQTILSMLNLDNFIGI